MPAALPPTDFFADACITFEPLPSPPLPLLPLDQSDESEILCEGGAILPPILIFMSAGGDAEAHAEAIAE